MNETTPIPPEKTIVVDNSSCRLRTLVFVSLGLNGLILAILFIGFLCHLHHGSPRFEGYGGRGGHFHAMDRGFDHRFHGFGGHKFGMNPGWERQDECKGGSCPAVASMGERAPGKNGFGAPLAGNPGMGMNRSEPPSPAEMTDRMVEGLSNQLSLTDDQKTKLHPIIEQQVTQMQKDMEARHEAMQKLMDDTKAKIKPILDADQQKKLDQLKPPGPPSPQE